jgi:type IV fimbrial biogenesis protein FimT
MAKHMTKRITGRIHHQNTIGNSQGFTLIELLISVAILAMLLAVVSPAISNVMLDNRRNTQFHDFISDLTQARSEAARLNKRVVLCKTDGADFTQCSTDAGDTWADGWLIFADENEDDEFDTSDGDELLVTHQAITGGYTLQPTGANLKDWMAYRPTGEFSGSGGNSGTIQLCAPGDAQEDARYVALTGVGRPRVSGDHSTAWVNCP